MSNVNGGFLKRSHKHLARRVSTGAALVVGVCLCGDSLVLQC